VTPERCVTCSDEAVEAVVVSVEGVEAIVRAGADEERVAIDLVPDAAPGDVLLCHAGLALERVEA
jgi:hydrogenase maturation factor